MLSVGEQVFVLFIASIIGQPLSPSSHNPLGLTSPCLNLTLDVISIEAATSELWPFKGFGYVWDLMEEFWGIDREDGEILPEDFDERGVALEAADERTTMV